MKNQLLLILFTVLFCASSFAQGIASVSEAADIAREIVKASNKKSNFLIKEGRVANAMAVVMNGKRYVLYNPGFINQLTQATGTRWAAVSVLAHEIGHHLYSQVSNRRTVGLSTELEADEFSGYILKKLGASLEEAQAAMKLLASESASRTHPGRSDRLYSIEKGWESTVSQGSSIAAAIPAREPTYEAPARQGRSEPVAANTTGRPGRTAPDPRISYILATIDFKTDPGVQYYVTDKYSVVKIKNNRAYTVGKMARLSDQLFPFMIYDGENKVYVDSSGRILTERGNTIGALRMRRR